MEHAFLLDIVSYWFDAQKDRNLRLGHGRPWHRKPARREPL